MQHGGWIGLAGLLLVTSCRPVGVTPPRPAGQPVEYRAGVEPTTRMPPDVVVTGQTVYVPVHSSIATADNARPINLAVTLTVRNLDREGPIVVQAIAYHDSGVTLIRESLPNPVRLGPLATHNLFVGESDNTGGPSPSFLIEWAAGQEVTPPAVDAVMISTAGSLGLTLTATGRVIQTRHR